MKKKPEILTGNISRKQEVRFAIVGRDNQLYFIEGDFVDRILQGHQAEFIKITSEIARKIGDLFRYTAEDGVCVLRVDNSAQLTTEIQTILNSLRFPPRDHKVKFKRDFSNTD